MLWNGSNWLEQVSMDRPGHKGDYREGISREDFLDCRVFISLFFLLFLGMSLLDLAKPLFDFPMRLG